jgi:hypothetical protein
MRILKCKALAAALCGLVLLQGAAPPPLNTLLRQNLAAARSSYSQLAKPNMLGPQLWIHVRSNSQMGLVQGNLAWLRTLRWKGAAVDIRPLQVVSYGPPATELRFFKTRDRAATLQLQAQLSSRIPQLQVKDMSAEFSQATWLKPGHLELWLAPGLTQFGPPH